MASPATISPIQARSGRVTAFLDLFHTEAKGNPTTAASLAGYPDPKAEGARLARRYKAELERRASALRAAAVTSEDEVMQKLTALIRDPTHKDHVKAVEMGLRVFGKLSDKAQVDEPKANMVRELRLLLEASAKSVSGRQKVSEHLPPALPAIEAEVVQTHEGPTLGEQAGEGDAGS